MLALRGEKGESNDFVQSCDIGDAKGKRGRYHKALLSHAIFAIITNTDSDTVKNIPWGRYIHPSFPADYSMD